MWKVVAAVGWAALYASASVVVAVLVFGLLPTTVAGWLMAAALGVPAALLTELLLLAPFHTSSPGRPQPYSWSEMTEGLPERDARRRILRVVSRLALSVFVLFVLILGASQLLEAVPWIALQFATLGSP